jgi:hypothetical protein
MANSGLLEVHLGARQQSVVDFMLAANARIGEGRTTGGPTYFFHTHHLTARGLKILVSVVRFRPRPPNMRE